MKTLLVIDALVNLLVGLLLLIFPWGILTFLGLPPVHSYFYSSLLGAVIFGIGLALVLEVYGEKWQLRGLGIAGAIAINLCGGMALLFWLLFSALELSVLATLTLWIICIVVLLVGLAELKSEISKRKPV